jgi:hypothetical protein
MRSKSGWLIIVPSYSTISGCTKYSLLTKSSRNFIVSLPLLWQLMNQVGKRFGLSVLMEEKVSAGTHVLNYPNFVAGVTCFWEFGTLSRQNFNH